MHKAKRFSPQKGKYAVWKWAECKKGESNLEKNETGRQRGSWVREKTKVTLDRR